MTLSNVPASYDAMIEAAVKAATISGNASVKVAVQAKAWGHNYLRNVKIEGFDSLEMEGDTKRNVGWDSLKGDKIRAIKATMKPWFSKVKVILAAWSSLTPEDQENLLEGRVSFTTMADRIAKANKVAVDPVGGAVERFLKMMDKATLTDIADNQEGLAAIVIWIEAKSAELAKAEAEVEAVAA